MAIKKKQKRNYIKSLLENIDIFNNKELWKRTGIVGLIFISVILVISIDFFPGTFERGQVSPKTIFAQRDVVDVYTTERLQQEALAEISDVYKHDENIDESIMENIDAVFAILLQAEDEARVHLEGELEEKEADGEIDDVEIADEKLQEYEKEYAISAMEDEVGATPDEDMIDNVLELSRETLESINIEMKELISERIDEGIKEENLDEALEELKNEINALAYEENVQDFLGWLAVEVLEPNLIFDEEANEDKKEEAIESVEPVEILEGEVIVREGERISEKQAAILDELELMGSDRTLWMFVGLILLVAVVFLLIGLFIYYFREDIFINDRLLVLAGLILVATLLIAQGVSIFSEFLIPVAMASILYTVLFGARMSVMFVGMMAILVGIITDFNFEAIVVAMVGGLVGTFSVTKLQERGDLTRAGLYVATVNVIAIMALLLVTGGFSLEEQLLKSAYGIANGIFSGILAIGILPYLESGFGLTTPVRLLELSNPNHPLLKKLMMEAPGTYHHSIIVGNLAEAAAEKVGANTILARVGAYYHDVGKINRPYFFVENQFGKENPHNKISPSLSSLIIVSHVKEGVELAQEYKLPEVIQEIIKQHHGTNFVGYFFHQFQEEQENKAKLIEEDFKYKGPKPQTKEAAIVMMADSVEAAVRSMSDPTSHKIEAFVEKLVKKHLDEGQLNECHLTFKDLTEISKSFVQILLGIYHSRIQYPEELVKRSNLNGDYDKKAFGDESGELERDNGKSDDGNGSSKEKDG